jgi:MFS family permease
VKAVKIAESADNFIAMATTPSLSHVGEHHEEYGDANIPLTRATKLYAFCASINSCNLGYDIGVSTEAGRLVQAYFNLSTKQRELFVGSINFWASKYHGFAMRGSVSDFSFEDGNELTACLWIFASVFGALGSQYFTDRFGRRRTFIVAAIGFIIGVLIQTLAPSFAVLMIGRVFVGLGVGIGLAVSGAHDGCVGNDQC